MTDVNAPRVAQTGVGGDRESLVIIFTVERFQTELPELAGNEGSGFFQLRAARGTAAKFLGGEKLDVVKVGYRIDAGGAASRNPRDAKAG